MPVASQTFETNAVPPPIPMSAEATADNFDEAAYLRQNSDVAAAIKAGMFKSGWDHFVKVGQQEKRRQRLDAAIAQARARKLDKVRPHLRTDMTFRMENGRLNFLTEQLRKEAAIADTENVSAHQYDAEMLGLVEKYKNGLILDCGAGRRDVYYENVVNFEIVAYDSTDILGAGEHLPFQSNSFDAVFSVAVLEHVRDPFRCASEIARVLKRGGELYCAIPFLQPLHGYPHHYFNATPQGARRLFEDMLRIEDMSPFHPIWALTWIVQSWSEGLAGPTRNAFLDMPLRELLKPPLDLLQHPFATELGTEKQFELAAGTTIRATKERTDPEIGDSADARAWQQRLRDWLWRVSRHR